MCGRSECVWVGEGVCVCVCVRTGVDNSVYALLQGGDTPIDAIVRAATGLIGES